MKHLFFLLLTCSLQGYGQSSGQIDFKEQMVKTVCCGVSIEARTIGDSMYKPKPDTLRATLIVYYDGPSSILHTKNGFVVRQAYKDLIYLDDRRRVIKKPVEVLTFKLK